MSQKNTHDINKHIANILETETFPDLVSTGQIRQRFRRELRQANRKYYKDVYCNQIEVMPVFFTQDKS